MVARYGRTAETRLVLKMMLRTSPHGLLRMAPQGLELWRRGRMPLGQDRIRQPEQLRKVLDAMEES
jgi:hypothetical protein